LQKLFLGCGIAHPVPVFAGSHSTQPSLLRGLSGGGFHDRDYGYGSPYPHGYHNDSYYDGTSGPIPRSMRARAIVCALTTGNTRLTRPRETW
jgi:hypothetical protein